MSPTLPSGGIPGGPRVGDRGMDVRYVLVPKGMGRESKISNYKFLLQSDSTGIAKRDSRGCQAADPPGISEGTWRHESFVSDRI